MLTPTCDCPRAHHTHGENVMYVKHRCRCNACRDASMSLQRATRRAKALGRGYLTNAEPARRHVRDLMAGGMGWKKIATTAGIPMNTMSGLLYGNGPIDPRPPRKQISRMLEAKILSVELDPTTVSAVGTVRRVQALSAAGWSISRVAKRLSMYPSNLGRIMRNPHKSIRVETAKKIEAVFDELWDKRPPAANAIEAARVRRVRLDAAAKGWVPAAAWDDIDDLQEEPKANLADSIPARSRALVEKIDRLELLIQEGYGDNDDTFIRAGWGKQNSGYIALRRAGREDLINALRRNDIVRQVAS